jgi:hypothetical protein
MLASQQVTYAAPLMKKGRQEQFANSFLPPVLVHNHQIMSLSEKEETVLTDRKEQLRERKKHSETKNKWKESCQELFSSGSTTC